jgi:hypothetical protein
MTNLEAGPAATSEQAFQLGPQQVLQRSQGVRFPGDRKISVATEPGMKILFDQPKTRARVAAINKIAGTRLEPPFLNAAECAALKRICEG